MRHIADFLFKRTMNGSLACHDVWCSFSATRPSLAKPWKPQLAEVSADQISEIQSADVDLWSGFSDYPGRQFRDSCHGKKCFEFRWCSKYIHVSCYHAITKNVFRVNTRTSYSRWNRFLVCFKEWLICGNFRISSRIHLQFTWMCQ